MEEIIINPTLFVQILSYIYIKKNILSLFIYLYFVELNFTSMCISNIFLVVHLD